MHQSRQLFNDHYINIVQNSSGRKLTNVADTTDLVDNRDIVKLILETYTITKVSLQSLNTGEKFQNIFRLMR